MGLSYFNTGREDILAKRNWPSEFQNGVADAFRHTPDWQERYRSSAHDARLSELVPLSVQV